MSRLCVRLALFFVSVSLPAQVAVTAITTTTDTSAASTTENGTVGGVATTFTYQNDIRAVSTFVAGGETYTASSSATSVAVRRANAANANRVSPWVANGAGNTLIGTDFDSYGQLLLTNNLFQGSDNVFQNGAAENQSNVERLDFLWAAGISVLSTDGFTIFERGVDTVTHDVVQVAVITSLGTGLANTNTWTFGTVKELVATDYGSNLDLDNSGGAADTVSFRILRFNAGDTLTTHTNAATAVTGQGIAGTFIRFSDLGIADNTTIYGYAIMATDVTNVSANLADWSNTTNYSATTTTTTGGIDLASFNGQLSRRVPEPSTYGALFIGASLALVYWRKKRSPLTAPVA